MGTSVRYQGTHRIWRDISKEQWELLWSGETALLRYGAALWTAGHKTVNLLPDETAIQTPHIMCITGPVAQRHTAKVPSTKGLPHAARQTIEQYLKLVDWSSLLANKDPQENNQSWTSSTEFLTWQGTQQTKPTRSQDIGRLIQNLIHEPSEATLLEELRDIKHTISQDTPLSWLTETLMEELWNEEQFQGGDLGVSLSQAKTTQATTAPNAQPAKHGTWPRAIHITSQDVSLNLGMTQRMAQRIHVQHARRSTPGPPIRWELTSHQPTYM
jgi:hypothetical protein